MLTFWNTFKTEFLVKLSWRGKFNKIKNAILWLVSITPQSLRIKSYDIKQLRIFLTDIRFLFVKFRISFFFKLLSLFAGDFLIVIFT